MKAFISAVIGCLFVAVATAAILGSIETRGDHAPASQSVRLG